MAVTTTFPKGRGGGGGGGGERRVETFVGYGSFHQDRQACDRCPLLRR